MNKKVKLDIRLESYCMFTTKIAICEASSCVGTRNRVQSRSIGNTIEKVSRPPIQKGRAWHFDRTHIYIHVGERNIEFLAKVR
jgi:hypothetical protein